MCFSSVKPYHFYKPGFVYSRTSYAERDTFIINGVRERERRKKEGEFSHLFPHLTSVRCVERERERERDRDRERERERKKEIEG